MFSPPFWQNGAYVWGHYQKRKRKPVLLFARQGRKVTVLRIRGGGKKSNNTTEGEEKRRRARDTRRRVVGIVFPGGGEGQRMLRYRRARATRRGKPPGLLVFRILGAGKETRYLGEGRCRRFRRLREITKKRKGSCEMGIAFPGKSPYLFNANRTSLQKRANFPH